MGRPIAMSVAFSKHSSLARLLVAVLLGLTATAAVWTAAGREQSLSHAGFRELEAANGMLSAMLEQESSFRAYAELGEESFLVPYYRSRTQLEAMIAAARAGAGADEARESRSIGRQVELARTWQSSADETIARLRAGVRKPVHVDEALERKRLMERFRGENIALRRSLDQEREYRLARTGRVAAGVILLVSLLFGAGGVVVIERRARAMARNRATAAARQAAQGDFTETLQAMNDESEAHELVKRHLERSLPGSDIAVLNRNNSDNRLLAAASLSEDSPLAGKIAEANTTSCLAVRLGKTYRRAEGSEPLLKCRLCERTDASSLCTPSLVGGEVIGSVLVQRQPPLSADETRLVAESVERAAPVLANLRNLAVARTRAATDALTGLANRRSVEETVKRMIAQAARVQAPLSAILFDLDHFKQINDVHGHGKGDEVLAAVGDRVTSVVRASDFAGRYGGEEFIVLAPNTDREGALGLAEKLRVAIRALDVAHLDRAVAASFGVATYPHDAAESDELVRSADRALYVAKASGRNRVEPARTAEAATVQPIDEAAAEA